MGQGGGNIFVLLLCSLAMVSLVGCKAAAPSNGRVWTPDQAQLPYAIDLGSHLCIKNVRNCDYVAADDFTVRYEERNIDVDAIESVDFVVCPFNNMPYFAHTMLSFGMRDGQYLAVSVEIRKEQGEKYSPLLGGLRQYELMYVVADERDLIRLRTNYRGEDVYVYRTVATPEQSRALFLDVIERVNKLHRAPEFYDTLTNNCTNNIVAHVNRLVPERVPFTWKVLLPGFSDRYAYDLGLLASNSSFDETRQRAKVNSLALRHGDSPDFSQQIRR